MNKPLPKPGWIYRCTETDHVYEVIEVRQTRSHTAVIVESLAEVGEPDENGIRNFDTACIPWPSCDGWAFEGLSREAYRGSYWLTC